MTDAAKRRTLLALLLLTLVLVTLDIGGNVGSGLPGSGIPDDLRGVTATAFGPVQRVLAGADQRDASLLAQDNDLLRAQLAQARAELAQQHSAAALAASPATAKRTMLAGRVVGSASTVTGGRLVTLDIGLRDGVEPSYAVVSADGLVGRVTSVSEWSCDVRLLGGAQATVGVSVGTQGSIGTVSATPTGDVPTRAPGLLSLSVVQGGRVAVGDAVRTLGSVGGRPYVRDLVVGTVVAVDPARGDLQATAVVRPAVDPATLDVVAVLQPVGTKTRPDPASGVADAQAKAG